MTRLLSFSINGNSTFGVMGTEGVVDLGRRMPDIADLREWVAADRIIDARSHASDPGDVVEVSVPEIGTLRNTIADEFPPGSPDASLSPPLPQ